MTPVTPPADVLWRSMSPERMIDGGLAAADVRRLRDATDAGTPWDEALVAIAGDRAAQAEKALAAGQVVTAREAFRWSAAALLFAQMAWNDDSPHRVALYARFTATVARAGALADPAWEQVTLPFGDGRLFGWLVRPVGPVRGTVIVLGGQSGWGATYLRAADALLARGVAAFLVEGPGQGETRMRGGVLLDVDVRAAYSTFVDHVLADPSLGGSVGIWGNSMGGLFAGTAAASDPRISAVCVNGAPARPRLLGFRTFDEQAAAMLGGAGEAEVRANFDRIALQARDRITGAVLVVHGGQDPIVSREEQQPFLDAALGEATLREWEDGDHTVYRHGEERNAVVADWFADHLAPPRATLLDEVRASFAATPDPRTRAVLDAVTRHVHALVGEVRPTHPEWEQAIDFLTAVGQTCDDTRQEFVLLSDVLGVSMLVETLNGGDHGTESTVLGPFHMTASPRRALGDSISEVGLERPAVVTGMVVDIDGRPVPGASVDVWQCDEDGFYDVQRPDVQPAGNGRGMFTADADGAFWFRTVVPSHYPIPTDGPVGRLLEASERHPYRPAHVHLIVDAAGFEPLTTHLFVADSPYLDSDAVFAVKQSLVREFAVVDDPDEAERYGVRAPFRRAHFEVQLAGERREETA
ncbi:dioxygenase [Nocardioides sp. QY071]|uniref:dioxygenase family protein n=1 Tax=Nocardioides sp. QY071 TaxID=3044187 RepID=UPI002499B298|nr:dioxygenase [Nocardioides sp. QY071]WGY03785.1 dioxygenase [Nocardioides sp. QY071]